MDESNKGTGERFNARQRLFLEVYGRCLGNLTQAANATKIPRRTIYNWLGANPDFKIAFDSVGFEAHDFVESKLLQRIGKDDTRAIIFYLRTRCRHRGYF